MSRIFSHWFGNSRAASHTPRPKNRARLQVQRLEERDVPATLQVTSLLDNKSSGTLRAVIAEAKSGDTIDITVPGTIALSAGLGQLIVDENLSIVGLGASQNTITASGKTQVFDVNAKNVALNLSGLTITDGRSTTSGGAIQAQQAGDTVNLTNCVVSGSLANVAGGGVAAINLSITNSTISGNAAEAGGGGVVGQNIVINDSTISGNTAKTNGGGVADLAKITVTNSTITGNTASASGGGISMQNGVKAGPSTLNDDTIADNTSRGGGGIWVATYASLTMNNTIVADDTDLSKAAPDILGTVTAYNCLVLSTTGTTFLGSTSGDLFNEDPDLATLQNNGGSTQTMALQSGSPAINAGKNSLIPSGVTTDQTGNPRIVGATVDIGADELQTATTTPTGTGTTGTTTTTTGSGTGTGTTGSSGTGTSPTTLQVTSLLDNGSAGTLRSVIAEAVSGDTIDITVPGTITLNAGLDQLVINKNLSIVGLGANEDTITASAKTRVFYVSAANVTLNLSGLTITEARTAGNGAGIDAQQAGDTVNLTNCVVSDCLANLYGAGIYATNVTITNSTISGNSALENGGGVASANAKIVNSTIAYNTAAGLGGGIDFVNPPVVGVSSLLDDTIADNKSKSGGGGIAVGSKVSLAVTNTIVANDTDTTGKAPDILGTVTATNSLILSTTGATFLGSTSTDIFKQNPDLGPLQNNGGPTPTMALASGSPAIDAGNSALVPASVTTDQRGDPRIVGKAVDIGAYES